ncbi:MAG: 1-acyl-sn-glycerol-3-phosphate acyltransferase [Anaerolineales bacterium]
MNTEKGFTLRRKPWLFHVFRPLLAFVALYHRVVVTGEEHLPREGPALLLLKHRSTRDTLLFSRFLYRRTGRTANYLMKYGAAGLPTGLMEAFGAVPVIRARDILRLDGQAARAARLREARRRKQQAFDYVAWLYAQGELVAVYPEGRFCPHSLGPLDPSAVQHAFRTVQETGLTLPIVPVGIDYEDLRRPGSRVLFRIGSPRHPQNFPSPRSLLVELRRFLEGGDG